MALVISWEFIDKLQTHIAGKQVNSASYGTVMTPTGWWYGIVEVWLLLAAAQPVVIKGVCVAVPIPVAMPGPLLAAVHIDVAVAVG